MTGAQPGQGETPIGQHSDEDAEPAAVANEEPEPPDDDEVWPSGHREGVPATDDEVREAGQNR